ncbi:MAG TPA: hypothetical protein VH418_15665 [Solirubrobacteraceae bacterium]|jgi:hypothetical protein
MKRAAALMVAVLVVAGVAVAQARHQRARPSVRVLASHVAGGSVRFALDVSFRAPRCGGRIVARAAQRRWSGRLHRAATACHATVSGSVPRALAGRRVAFRISFRGNRRVAPFAVTRRVTLLPATLPKPLNTPPPG